MGLLGIETGPWPDVLQKISGWRLGDGHELAGKDQGSTVYQLGRVDGAVVFWRGPDAQQFLREVHRPLVAGQPRFQALFELAVSSLDQAVALRVVGCRRCV
jgi:hypothetical protein